MTVRRTSIEVYHQIEAEGLLSKRRWEVYKALYKYGPCTYNELHRVMLEEGYFGVLSQSNVSTRLGELRDTGAAEELPERRCAVTGRDVITWDVTDALPRKLEKSLNPTKREIIDALCKLVEHAPKWVTHPAWLEKSQKVLKEAEKHRKRKK